MKKVLFAAARSPIAGAVVRFAFAHARRLLPLRVVEEGALVAVYEHPRPVYGTYHHIAVPSVAVPDVLALADPRHAALRAELADVLARRGGTALVNAGPRQDVGQVHFHLTDDAMPGREAERDWPDWTAAIEGFAAAPGLEQRIAGGCTLLQRPGDPRVHLV
ncbi:hypothetical protein ACQEVB_06020 [Pseudonocardia sp. CA-107938]|uniref:hypothetical protein n=1 Tax=Pseudonocardia sp. CA-107938 TaxID=3240021 RepID=UPI003D8A30E1